MQHIEGTQRVAPQTVEDVKTKSTGNVVQETAVANSCCSATKQETCCEPSEKSDCCGSTSTSTSGSCGCQ